MLPFAVTQDGVASPADYNNIGSGNTNAQPLTVSLANLVAGTAGTLAASTAKQGYYEATIPNAFPVGAKMRSVALQGYWTQVSPWTPATRRTWPLPMARRIAERR
ncbi:MAG: hypothetical protein JSW36_09545 [Burkholderiales bacterium]|nr:MAG: hypothetical protein JSW36_09545 [Burkholderiales bacterium]